MEKNTGNFSIICTCLIVLTLFSCNGRTGETNPEQQGTRTGLTEIPAPPEPEPFEVSTIPLPEHVTDAVLVNYLPDGEHLVMEVHITGQTGSDIAVMKDDGSEFRCLTCGLDEEIGGEMPVPLPDGKAVYTPTGILECTPSILECKEARILPLVYPEVKGEKTLMRIATNLSPDGIHVAYTLITTGHALVLISELTRVSDEKGDRYELTNTRVAAGDKTFMGDPADLNISAFGGGEVKSFTGQGRYLASISAFESNNNDIAVLDLATGDFSRFTRHFSWDEGVYPSPDGEWIIVQTHRHTNRMDVFGLIPRPMIAGMALGYGVGYYRNEVVDPPKTNRRFYGLTMLDKYGDRARMPEDGYTGQNLTVAEDNLTEYNHFGNFAWHPTSTRGVFWEQKDHQKVKAGEANGRLRMIRFTTRQPSTPMEPFTPEMKWAQKLENFHSQDGTIPEKGRIRGAVSGYAEFTNGVSESASADEGQRFEITYADYSDDGIHILNGTESRIEYTFDKGVLWNADISVTGQREGYLKAENVRFYPWSIGLGIIRTKLGEHYIEVDLARGIPTGVPGELR